MRGLGIAIFVFGFLMTQSFEVGGGPSSFVAAGGAVLMAGGIFLFVFGVGRAQHRGEIGPVRLGKGARAAFASLERGQAVFAALDALEADEFEFLHLGGNQGEAASPWFPQRSPPQVADWIDSLVRRSGGNVNDLLSLVDIWTKRRTESLDEVEKDRRRFSAIRQLVITSSGNLFGFITDDEPTFDPELAAEGMRRNWRS